MLMNTMLVWLVKAVFSFFFDCSSDRMWWDSFCTVRSLEQGEELASVYESLIQFS